MNVGRTVHDVVPGNSTVRRRTQQCQFETLLGSTFPKTSNEL